MIAEEFFFFQAEDGIRDLTVTGVQTCALPILKAEQARIQTQEQLDIREENRQREVAVAQQNRERAVVIEVEKVTRAKELEIVARQREVELQRIEKEKAIRSEEHTSELQSQSNLVCRL